MKPRISSVFVFLVLSFAAAAAAAPCPAPRTTEALAPGLEHLVLCRGEVATSTSYRILIGVFGRQSEADQMLDRLHTNGFSAVADADGTDYRIVIPGFPHRTEAEDMRTLLIDRGFSLPLEVQEIQRDLSHPEGPWKIHVLVVDPKKNIVRVAHAYDAAIGLETTAVLARRRGALAAINGGYFRMGCWPETLGAPSGSTADCSPNPTGAVPPWVFSNVTGRYDPSSVGSASAARSVSPRGLRSRLMGSTGIANRRRLCSIRRSFTAPP